MRVYGIIINVKTIVTKNQKIMAFLELQNDNNIIAVTVFAKLYQSYQEYLQINRVILMDVKVEVYQEKLHLVLVRIIDKI